MAVRHERAPVVGIDLGGTKTLVGIVDAQNRILGRAKRPTPAKEGADAILRTMLDAVEEALGLASVSRSDLLAVGVGSPGPLDLERGVILHTPNLNVRDFPLGPELAKALGRPVLVQNDVRVGGYGEFRLGAGRGYRDIIAAFVGTGIGGCIISAGQMLAGRTGNAGEVGHIVVKAGGAKCGCGSRGCLEAVASKTAIARRIGKAIRKGIPSVLSSKLDSRNSRLKSRDLAAAVAANDAVAIREVKRAAHYLGLGMGSLVNVLGPEIVIIGGGVSGALGAPWIDMIRIAARQQILVDPDKQIKIELAGLGDDAGILGASLLAREKFARETVSFDLESPGSEDGTRAKQLNPTPVGS
ncbi:MAG TPA: ROK family protein [Isosphaeraceae bacterium]|jgi:glucokinase|nr:ROK family protein [Isosphaeraceae bacterium]